jgi:hypothetical protein
MMNILALLQGKCSQFQEVSHAPGDGSIITTGLKEAG